MFSLSQVFFNKLFTNACGADFMQLWSKCKNMHMRAMTIAPGK